MRRRKSVLRPLVFIGALMLPSTNAPDTFAPPTWIEGEFVSSGAASLTMVAARDGEVVWSQSWGWADKARRRRATPQTSYAIASLSKSFTATGLMVLVDRGLIDLDRPINDYLGAATQLRGLGGDAREATVRRIATHTAGLALHQNFFFADETRRMPSTADAIARYGVMVRPPGERFEYSNLGYGILEQAIAHVSNQSYAAFMQREVFAPLGLTHTAVGPPPGHEGDVALNYARDGTLLPAFEQDTRGSGSLYASAEDLARFAFLYLRTLDRGQRQILGDAALQATQQRTAVGPYGFGWIIDPGTGSGPRVIWNSGSMDGVGTVMFLVPAHRVVVVALCNTGIDLPVRAAVGVMERMLPDVHVTLPFMREPAEGPVPATLAGEWRGDLVTHEGKRPLRIRIDAAGVHARLGDAPEIDIFNAAWAGERLIGSFSADVGTRDVRRPHRLRFALARRQDRLDGSLSAWSFREGRSTDILSSFVSLQRDNRAPSSRFVAESSPPHASTTDGGRRPRRVGELRRRRESAGAATIADAAR